MLVNLTPHDITLITDSGNQLVLSPSGVVTRLVVREELDDVHHAELGAVGSIPVYRTTTGRVEQLPDPVPGTLHVVSRAVAEVVRRPDVVCVHRTVRDDHGQVVGARALARFSTREGDDEPTDVTATPPG